MKPTHSQNAFGRALAAALGFALALSACGDDKPQAASAPAASSASKAADPGKKDAKGDSKDQKASPAAFTYQFSADGKRDPFRSPSMELRETQGPKDLKAPCDQPLCQYNMNDLQLVAVVTGDASPIAMVQDGSGHGFVVRRNMMLGKSGGRVTQILRDSVVVTEYTTTPDGKLKPETKSLTLQKDHEHAAADIDLETGKALQ